jgi:molybdopterin-guanine dinucleotide biosynthesis protein A
MTVWPCVVAVCGASGSGKTTLIEGLIPRLQSQGLTVGAIKSCSHPIEADRRGKDSDRLFRAGADVLAHDARQELLRVHSAVSSLEDAVAALRRQYDLLLVEGHAASSAPKIWLLARGQRRPPDEIANVIAALPPGPRRAEEAERHIRRVLRRAHAGIPCFAGVLIGGESRRMGRSKALLRVGRVTMLEKIVAIAQQVADNVILLGGGQVPAALRSMPRLPDAATAGRGPMAGLMAAMRWNPDARWLLFSCDLPLISVEAVRWLRAQARPGRWAVMPLADSARTPQPLFALYEPPISEWLEAAALRGDFSLRRVVAGEKVATPLAPPKYRNAWINVNTPEEYAALAAHRPRLRPSG